MKIKNISASAYKCHDECPLKYFGTYVLKWRGPSNKAAAKGTIVHEVLENLAHLDFEANVDLLIEESYQKYTTGEEKHHDWTDKDFKDCSAWTYKVLDYEDGKFDPRNLNVIATEQWFDLDILQPWAEVEEGWFSIRGFIDLVIKHDEPNMLEILDWKTGQTRKDWVTGKEKNESNLKDDVQLRLYHLAATELYNVDTVMTTLFFVNAGGPFTVVFTKDDLEETYRLLQNKFEFIKGTTVPSRNRSWKCKKFCQFGTTTFEHTGKRVLASADEIMTQCDQLYYELKQKGIEVVTHEYKNPRQKSSS